MKIIIIISTMRWTPLVSIADVEYKILFLHIHEIYHEYFLVNLFYFGFQYVS